MTAKIFISCGQARGTDEARVAREVGRVLSELGFEYYIAVEEQSLKGIKENVFRQLETSEYYLFIDFKREQLYSSSGSIFRGSLFTHQELAIAAYLDIPVLAFQEEGVKYDDGLMGFIQGNSVVFKKRSSLPELTEKLILQHGWRSDWKNTLAFAKPEAGYVDAPGYDGEMTRYLYLAIKNEHQRKLATNCYVYLQRVTDLASGRDIPVHWVEFKWAGYTMPNTAIGAGRERLFDAGNVRHATPSSLQFSAHSDSPEYWDTIPGPGQFQLVYIVHSEAFVTQEGAFRLTLGERLEDVRLEPLS